jgi:hypothetical protein
MSGRDADGSLRVQHPVRPRSMPSLVDQITRLRPLYRLRLFEVSFGSDALKTPIRPLVKNKRTTSNLFAREHLAQDDIVVARLVDRGDPATELSRGTLQQGQPVSAECDGKILKSVLLVSREAGRQFRLMLAKNVHREEAPVADSCPSRAALACANEKHAGLQRDRCQRVYGRAEKLAAPFGCDDGDPGCKGSHDRPELLGIDGDTAGDRASVSLPQR